jgi:Protein of unknown function (DUF2971)
MAHLSQAAPSILYHYTSLEVLQKIIQSGLFWASNLRYLNDTTEFAYVLTIVANRVKELAQTADEPKLTVLRDLETLLLAGMKRNAFIACFSERRDDLSQWRGYCPPGLGVCIGFSTAAIKAGIEIRNIGSEETNKEIQAKGIPLLGKVIYLHPDSGSSFDSIIDQASLGVDFGIPGLNSTSLVQLLLSGVAPFYKNDHFAAEQEWRILVGEGATTSQNRGIKFRMGKSTLVPYAEIDLKTRDSQFIKEVIIGPSPNISLSVEAVGSLLSQHSMDHVRVTESAVPYRHW